MNIGLLALSDDAETIFTMTVHPADPKLVVVLVTWRGLDMAPIMVPIDALKEFINGNK